MEKILNINGIECKFKSSGATPLLYRRKFNRDLMVDMLTLTKQMKKAEKSNKQNNKAKGNKKVDDDVFTFPIESLEMFEGIAYVMHKQGDPTQPNNIIEWLDQFEFFNIYEILPELVDMWEFENKRMSIPKK